jgi:hypothetical protein
LFVLIVIEKNIGLIEESTKQKMKYDPADHKNKTIAECALSLGKAMQEAGGTVDPKLLDMTLGEFITKVAAINNIRFVCTKPEKGHFCADD